MKKLFLFLSICLVAVSFNFCNNDDDNETDKIIGKWQLNQEFLNNVEESIDVCDKMITIEFFTSGVYTEIDFELDDLQTNCLALEDVSGTWENTGSSNYKLTDISSIPGTDIAIQVKITFETKNMTVEFTETSEEETFSYKAIFIKVISSQSVNKSLIEPSNF